MLLTLCEVLVMLGLPTAVGAIVCRLLYRQKTLSEGDWIAAPFLGASVIVLPLQQLFYAGVPVGRTAWPLLGVCAIAGLLLSLSRAGRARWGRPPLDLFGVAAGVFLFHGLGLLRVGADRYLGRALGDQFNYISMAEYVARRRFGVPKAIDWAAFEWIGANYSTHRIGEVVLQGFLAAVAPGTIKTWFEPLIIWSVFLLALALFSIARALGLSRRQALVTAAAASVVPAAAYIHLESFLSQALAVPFLFQTFVLAARTRERGAWQDAAIYGLVGAGTAAIYFEFAPFLAATGLVLLASTLISRSSRTWPRVLGVIAGSAAPLVLNDARSLLNIAASVGVSVLGFMYPWALSIEGLQRLWLGDFGSLPSLVMSPLIRFVALAVTAAGFAGLVIALRERLLPWRQDDAAQGNLLLVLLVSGIAVVPLLLIIKDADHPYQVYKIWLSIGPLLACGCGVVAVTIAASLRAWPRLARLVPAAALMLAGVSAVATTDMVVASSRSGPDDLVRRQTTPALRDDFAGAERFLASTSAKDVVLCSTADSLSGYVNGWLAYFARQHRAWPLNPVFGSTYDLRVLAPDPDHLRAFPPTLERGSVVMTTVEGGWWAEGSETSLVWAQGAYAARATTDRPMAFLCHNLLRPAPDGRTATVTLAGTLRDLPIVSSVAQAATLIVHPADPASDAMLAQRQLIVNGAPAPSHAVGNELRVYTLALRPGLNRAEWRTRIDEADPMWPVSVTMTGVRFILGQGWVTLDGIENANGVERVEGDPFFWMGKGETVLSLLAGEAGKAVLKFDAVPGPSRSEPTRRVRITTTGGYDQVVAIAGGAATLDVPVVPGRQEIRLRPVDPAVIPIATDQRPLLLGVRRLTVSFAPAS